ncbi:MAG: hypothetical protein V4598_02270 [Bdellovibrionota bacterium]
MKIILILITLLFAHAAFAVRCTPEIYREDAESFCEQELQEKIAQMDKDIKGLNQWLIFTFGDEDMRIRHSRECLKIRKGIYQEVLRTGKYGQTPVPASEH